MQVRAPGLIMSVTRLTTKAVGKIISLLVFAFLYRSKSVLEGGDIHNVRQVGEQLLTKGKKCAFHDDNLQLCIYFPTVLFSFSSSSLQDWRGKRERAAVFKGDLCLVKVTNNLIQGNVILKWKIRFWSSMHGLHSSVLSCRIISKAESLAQIFCFWINVCIEACFSNIPSVLL